MPGQGISAAAQPSRLPAPISIGHGTEKRKKAVGIMVN
jgi:hypothetical protein